MSYVYKPKGFNDWDGEQHFASFRYNQKPGKSKVGFEKWVAWDGKGNVVLSYRMTPVLKMDIKGRLFIPAEAVEYLWSPTTRRTIDSGIFVLTGRYGWGVSSAAGVLSIKTPSGEVKEIGFGETIRNYKTVELAPGYWGESYVFQENTGTVETNLAGDTEIFSPLVGGEDFALPTD